MIPHRMLTSEICGNGLKDRVAACRRRLRVNRVAHKVRDAQARPLRRALEADINSASQFTEPGSERSEEMLLVAEEVGIT